MNHQHLVQAWRNSAGIFEKEPGRGGEGLFEEIATKFRCVLAKLTGYPVAYDLYSNGYGSGENGHF
jgi:hypothetical protein